MEQTNERWKQFGTTYAANPKRTMKGQSNDSTYERYWWISDHGRVKVTTNYNDSIKWPKISLTGGQRKQYLAISNNNLIEKYIHRLVARFFISPPPETGERMTVNHKDGNKLNNHYSNLEWITYRENVRHYWEARRAHQIDPDNEYASMAIEVVRTMPRRERDDEIISLYQEGWTLGSIVEKLSLSRYVVSTAVREWRQANNIKTRNRRR